jgi:hypothetical protein
MAMSLLGVMVAKVEGYHCRYSIQPHFTRGEQ